MHGTRPMLPQGARPAPNHKPVPPLNHAHLQPLAAQLLLRLAVVQLQQRLNGIEAEQQAARVLLAVHCTWWGRDGYDRGMAHDLAQEARRSLLTQACPQAQCRGRLFVTAERVHASSPARLLC